jgi:hypothetical protein
MRQQGVNGGLVLKSLGELALERGETAAARDYFETFLIERHKIGERWGVVWALRGLGAVAQADGSRNGPRGCWERRWRCASPWLYSSGDRFRLSEKERMQSEALRSALQENLGAAACEAAWVDGYALTLEQAVEYALEAKQT